MLSEMPDMHLVAKDVCQNGGFGDVVHEFAALVLNTNAVNVLALQLSRC